MQHHCELTYARPTDRWIRRCAIRTVETLSGKRKLTKLYAKWQRRVQAGEADAFGAMLELMRIRLDISGAMPAREHLPDRLVMVANHPLGIADGAALLTLAERLGRPFRILINNDLMKIPEMAAYGLPVSFEETKAALAMNMETRRQAVKLLAEGVTIVVFPAGGVATAPKPFGRAEDLPWKQFTARLVQQGQASVLPVWFDGQNGPLFHAVSRFSLTLRVGMLIGEFRRLYGKAIRMQIGDLIPYDSLALIGDRRGLTECLRMAVFALSPTPLAQSTTIVRIAA